MDQSQGRLLLSDVAYRRTSYLMCQMPHVLTSSSVDLQWTPSASSGCGQGMGTTKRLAISIYFNSFGINITIFSWICSFQTFIYWGFAWVFQLATQEK